MSAALPGGAVIDMTRGLPALSVIHISAASPPTATDPSTRISDWSGIWWSLPSEVRIVMLWPGR
jgi:hypothetical protein